MATSQDRIERFADTMAQRIAKSPASSAILTRRTLLKRCGWSKASAQNLQRISKALMHYNIKIQPPLEAGGLTPSTKLTFSFNVSPGFMFSSEADLQRFLIANFSRLSVFSGLQLVKEQYRLPSQRRIDILARRTNGSKDYVVIELKAGVPGQGTLEQLVTYVEHFRQHRAEVEGVGVDGWLITGSRHRDVESYWKQHHPLIAWYTYSVNLECTSVTS